MCCVLPNVYNENLFTIRENVCTNTTLNSQGLVFPLVTLPVTLRFPELIVEGHKCAPLEIKYAAEDCLAAGKGQW